ncbi:MAG: class I SAM-dependent methyltransferase [Chloroflexi bacterium]|nr:MAG: class I SAM-dependent methyltransferase [Chloroflexota bacterium]
MDTINHQHHHHYPVLEKDTLAGKYDTLASNFSKRVWLYKRLQWLEELFFGSYWRRRRLMKRATGHVLEVACGSGENFSALKHVQSIVAVDLSEGMLELAQQRAAELQLAAIDIRRMDAESLEFPDAHFDTVVSTLATCTFPDPIAALQEMARVCKPDGRILLMEHGRSSLDWFARYQDRHAQQHFASVGCRWNQEPQEIVRAAGLEIVSAKRGFFGVFHTIEARPAQQMMSE